jgi:hypothetical protein
MGDIRIETDRLRKVEAPTDKLRNARIQHSRHNLTLRPAALLPGLVAEATFDREVAPAQMANLHPSAAAA